MEKGKNFSTNNASGKRRKSDLYETPYSMTKQFLDNWYHGGRHDTILEPACGNGAIVRVLREYGYMQIIDYDLVNVNFKRIAEP